MLPQQRDAQRLASEKAALATENANLRAGVQSANALVQHLMQQVCLRRITPVSWCSQCRPCPTGHNLPQAECNTVMLRADCLCSIALYNWSWHNRVPPFSVGHTAPLS